LLVSSSFFDRYNVPLITVFLVILAFIPGVETDLSKYPLILIALFFYISVLGTKDYLTVNRIRWQAVDVVKKEKGAPIDRINGGFEVNCWNDGFYSWWANYINLDDYDYVIQYNNEPGFELYKEYEFQRYLPYMTDKIGIYKRIVPMKRE
jgi:hypothetical protein